MAVLAGTTALESEEIWMVIYMVAVFLYMFIGFMIYYHFHKKMKEIKSREKWHERKKEVLSVDISFYQQRLTYSNGWFAIPFVIMLATTFLTYVNYDKFPEKLPMQYSLAGEVTSWADKSIRTLFMFPLMQLFMIGLFLFINIIINRSKQQIDPAYPQESIKQNIVFRRRWSLFTIVCGTIMILLFALPQISFLYPVDPTVMFVISMGIPILIVTGALILTITTGQGGSRVKMAVGKNGEQINRDDDQYWKLGIFYFNPDDPALWVEKRFGSGWTSTLPGRWHGLS